MPIDSPPLRVVLAGDSQLMSDGLESLLRSVSGVEVVDRVHGADDLPARVDEVEPDAVVISLRTRAAVAMSVIHSTRQLRAAHPELGIVIVSDRGNGYALEMLRGGSARTAYLLDEQLGGIEAVVTALHQVLSGSTVLDPGVVDALVYRRDAVTIDHLTLRELEVLEQISHGLANKTIAAELRITIKAVENHVTSIFRKLHLTDRPDLHQRVAAALTYVDRTN